MVEWNSSRGRVREENEAVNGGGGARLVLSEDCKCLADCLGNERWLSHIWRSGGTFDKLLWSSTCSRTWRDPSGFADAVAVWIRAVRRKSRRNQVVTLREAVARNMARPYSRISRRECNFFES